jgi:hypothetical protein
MTPNPEKHTADCLKRMTAWRRQNATYLAKWPNHCTDCRGTGEVYDLNEEPDFCETCLANDQCPRCSGPFVYRDGNSRCPACGWEVGEEVMVWPPECDCYGPVAEETP